MPTTTSRAIANLRTVCPFVLAFAGVFCAPVQGSTIFTSLGPGNAYNSGNSLGVFGAGSFAGADIETAATFTSSTTQSLAQIDLALTWISGINAATVTLRGDSGGLPGSVLATWDLTSLPSFGLCCTLQTLTPVGSLIVSAGVPYWIVASPIPDSDTLAGWNVNSVGITGTFAQNTGSGFFSESGEVPAFDVIGVDGIGAPEPSALVLTIIGLVSFVVLRERLKP